MSFATLIVLALAGITSIFLFGMIYIGAKNRSQMQSMESNLKESTSVMKGDFKAIINALEGSEKQQERILSRLENLETIVTSEAWDAIQAGEDEETIDLYLNEEEENIPDSEEAVKRMVKRIKQ
ncbi:hypothetical protein [Gracilimonas sp. BCB1]|uniref:hypothetical protein n=1 Tax=Gracilimonas sp. BCB1 TaxID=3152362 RepID=UPI0032D8D783